MAVDAARLAVAAALAAAALSPSVHYIRSAKGNFFMAPGKTIPDADVALTLPASSTCHCKSMCFVRLSCLAWSFVNLTDGTSECRLADAGPSAHLVENNTDAVYFFLQASVEGDYRFDVDGLLYLKPAELTTYASAKERCERIPGHRLGIYKTTQQYQMLGDFTATTATAGSLYMDLKKVGDDLIWGDGTSYNDTEIGKAVVVKPFKADARDVMVFWENQLSDAWPDENRKFMCQANPIGVVW
ncbi:uncharacterized protein LOC125024633 [Penaeus chinensis]|uniref:uncharacterized protein LOC125024633 n=1 Tax=Penaeus chinensis TaxID=139456 RepID=UPI001FB6B01D|nr:uncharacterized protein LOC125024633 [Penaeus chinensis]